MHLPTVIFLAILNIFLLPLTSYAILPQQIELQFAPLSGSIIIPIANEYLIDVDASTNLQIGEILTLVIPGEEVLHPISKEILGTLDSPTGFLQVTRIESGYCYAKLLYSDSPPQKGDSITRFQMVPSLFVDKQGNGAEIYRELKRRLPKLKWQQPKNTQKVLLFFTLKDNWLTVTNGSQTLLYRYFLGEDRSDPAIKFPLNGAESAVDVLLTAPQKDSSPSKEAGEK